MAEVKTNMDRKEIEKLLKMSLAEVIDFLIKTNNKSKAAQTGFLMDTDLHQLHLMIIRKPISKVN
jgi:hypothetical protein